jgi:hypothetical protein
MKSDNEILADYSKNLSKFQSTYNLQRMEISNCYEMKAGHQFTGEETADRKHLDKPVVTVNVAASYIDAIAGSDVVNGKRAEYVPAHGGYDKEADLMNDAAKYIEYTSGLESERLMSMKDTLTCGIGSYVNHQDYTKKHAIAGEPKVTRIYPAFTFFDTSVRGSRINADAKFMGYVDPVDCDSLTQYIEEKKGKDYASDGYAYGGGADTLWFMSYLRADNIQNLEFLSYYFWWDFEPLYDVKNPFTEGTTMFRVIQENEDAANLLGELLVELRIDQMQPYYSFNGDQYKRFKEFMEALELLTGVQVEKLEYSKRQGRCYYKAEIARGMVLTKSKCFTQDGFPQVFIVGNYDEVLGIYYGLMRPLFDLQRALNFSYSDLLGYVSDVATGGGAYVKGSIDNIKKLQESKANAKKLTYITQDMDIIAKAKADTLSSLTTFIQITLDLFPKVLGTPPEFMGTLSTKDMGSGLYAQVMKQATLALSSFANNSAGAIKRQAEINVDFAKLLARQIDGYPIQILSPNKEQKDFEYLTKDRLADQYKIIVVERPMNADERREIWQQFNELAPIALQSGANMGKFMTAAVEYAPIDLDARNQIIDSFTPPPPPPPDPLNQALVESQVAMQQAQAADLGAKAKKASAEADKIAASIGTEDDQAKLQLIKTISEIELNQAKAEQTMASIGDKIMSRMDAMESKMHERKESQPILVNNDMSAIAKIMEQSGGQSDRFVDIMTQNNTDIAQMLSGVINTAMMAEREIVTDENGNPIATRIKG